VIICAYFTDDRYAKEAARLERSLTQWGYPSFIMEREDLGGWHANTRQKPTFLKEMLDYGLVTLYVDADAEVVKDPRWCDKSPSDGDFDVWVYRRPQGELLSGTLLLRPTDLAFRLLFVWEHLCRTRPEKEWDQRLLDDALQRVPNLRVGQLPPEFCCIFDIGLRDHPGLEPVIIHHQASRRFGRH